MKYLNKFLRFDFDDFMDGKRFITVGRKDWVDFNTKEFLGTKVELVIIEDNTDYNLKEGEIGSNLYERIVAKVPKNLDIPMNVEVCLQDVEANVYGDYRNQISVVANEIVIVGKK